MLTLPTAPPPKALKRLHFREAVLAEFYHHAGACIDTRSALDAFVSVNFKMRPAFRWQESPQAPFGIYSRASALKDPSSPEYAFIQNAKNSAGLNARLTEFFPFVECPSLLPSKIQLIHGIKHSLSRQLYPIPVRLTAQFTAALRRLVCVDTRLSEAF